MTDTDEGKAALEAAAEAYGIELALRGRGKGGPMKAAIRAYLQALPGWRLVPKEAVRDARLRRNRHLTRPPGLETDSHE